MLLTRITTLASLLAAASFALAGPLDPPPGPVSSSGPSLLDVHDNDRLADTVDDIDELADELALLETRTDVLSLPGDAMNRHIISEPGSYYLSDTLVVDENEVTGVLITADHVTLDLAGNSIVFTAPGDNPAVPGPWGVYAESGVNVVVRNGSVSDFPIGQVRINGDIGRFENISAHGGGANSVVLTGQVSGMIIGCVVDSPTGSSYGVSCSFSGYGYVLADTHARLTTNIGISSSQASVMRDCTVVGNSFNTAYSVSQGSVLRRCTSQNSAGNGFSTGPINNGGAIFADCSVYNAALNSFNVYQSALFRCSSNAAGGNGFYLRSNNYVYGCTALDSDDDGFFIDNPGNRVEECHAESVAAIPANYGFRTDASASGCFIVRNTAVSAFDTFNNGAVNTSIFAPDWFVVTQAGPWDNLSQ